MAQFASSTSPKCTTRASLFGRRDPSRPGLAHIPGARIGDVQLGHAPFRVRQNLSDLQPPTPPLTPRVAQQAMASTPRGSR